MVRRRAAGPDGGAADVERAYGRRVARARPRWRRNCGVEGEQGGVRIAVASPRLSSRPSACRRESRDPCTPAVLPFLCRGPGFRRLRGSPGMTAAIVIASGLCLGASYATGSLLKRGEGMTFNSVFAVLWYLLDLSSSVVL